LKNKWKNEINLLEAEAQKADTREGHRLVHQSLSLEKVGVTGSGAGKIASATNKVPYFHRTHHRASALEK
jgi:hypothetical protein